MRLDGLGESDEPVAIFLQLDYRQIERLIASWNPIVVRFLPQQRNVLVGAVDGFKMGLHHTLLV